MATSSIVPTSLKLVSNCRRIFRSVNIILRRILQVSSSTLHSESSTFPSLKASSIRTPCTISSVVTSASTLDNDKKNIRKRNFIPYEKVMKGLSAKQLGQIAIYVDTLLEWNKQMNLTAVTDREAVMERHVAESLSLVPFIEEIAFDKHTEESNCNSAKFRIIDVGTGAGLPGMLLAVARPGWEIILLESLRKRCNFLEAAVKLMNLENVNVVWSRAEEAGQGELRETCHVAVARAVAELRILAELCVPFVKVGGHFLAPKGPKSEEEVLAAENAMALLGAARPEITQWEGESANIVRTVITCRKDFPTPEKYPRRPGMPNKRPL